MTRKPPIISEHIGLRRTPLDKNPQPEHLEPWHTGWKEWCPLCVELRKWVYERCDMEIPEWGEDEHKGKGTYTQTEQSENIYRGSITALRKIKGTGW